MLKSGAQVIQPVASTQAMHPRRPCRSPYAPDWTGATGSDGSAAGIKHYSLRIRGGSVLCTPRSKIWCVLRSGALTRRQMKHWIRCELAHSRSKGSTQSLVQAHLRTRSSCACSSACSVAACAQYGHCDAGSQQRRCSRCLAPWGAPAHGSAICAVHAGACAW